MNTRVACHLANAQRRTTNNIGFSLRTRRAPR
jgi:hypothetical protein